MAGAEPWRRIKRPEIPSDSPEQLVINNTSDYPGLAPAPTSARCPVPETASSHPPLGLPPCAPQITVSTPSTLRLRPPGPTAPPGRALQQLWFVIPVPEGADTERGSQLHLLSNTARKIKKTHTLKYHPLEENKPKTRSQPFL